MPNQCPQLFIYPFLPSSSGWANRAERKLGKYLRQLLPPRVIIRAPRINLFSPRELNGFIVVFMQWWNNPARRSSPTAHPVCAQFEAFSHFIPPAWTHSCCMPVRQVCGQRLDIEALLEAAIMGIGVHPWQSCGRALMFSRRFVGLIPDLGPSPPCSQPLGCDPPSPSMKADLKS